MSWQAISARTRDIFTRLRTRLPRRQLIWRAALISLAVGFIAITTEAVMRARLDTPRARVPTTLYTRAVPWRSGGERRSPRASL